MKNFNRLKIDEIFYIYYKQNCEILLKIKTYLI